MNKIYIKFIFIIVVLLNAGSAFGQIPTISSISPLSGSPGAIVNINGTNFTGITNVTFGGLPAASYVVNSINSITATAGVGNTGVVAVTNGSGTAFSESIIGSNLVAPSTTGWIPAWQTISSSSLNTLSNIVLRLENISSSNSYGLYLELHQTDNDPSSPLPGLKFNSVLATSSSVNISPNTPASEIRFNFPAGFSMAANTRYYLVLKESVGNPGGTGQQRIYFNFGVSTTGGAGGSFGALYYKTNRGSIFTFAPSITSFSPLSGPVGTFVTVVGTNFSSVVADNKITLGGITITPISGTANSLVFQVPSGAAYDKITVNVSGGRSSQSLQSFNVTQVCSSKILQSAVSYPAGIGVTAVSSGDFNKDGIKDLAYTGGNNVYVRLGLGNGNFGAQTTLAATNTAQEVQIGDFNGDGNQDLIATNSGASAISLFIGTGLGTFSTKIDLTTGLNPYNAVIADFNRDGNMDIAATNNGASTMSLLLGNGNGTFSAFTTVTVGNGPRGIDAGDINNDGIIDLVVANYASATGTNFSILLGNGNGTFQSKVDRTTISAGIKFVKITDLNSDGFNDVVVVCNTGNNIARHMGNGTTAMGAATVITNTSNIPNGIALADFNSDGNIDLAMTNTAATYLYVANGNGNGTFATPITYNTTNGSNYVAIADFDNDGNQDIVASSNADADVKVILSKCIPTITSFTPVNGPIGTFVTVVGTNFSTIPANNQITLNGIKCNVISSSISQLVFTVPLGVSYDRIDLRVGNRSTKSKFYFNVTNTGSCQTFAPFVEFPTGSTPQDIAVGDFNNDGLQDIVTANGSNSVSILMATGLNAFGGLVNYTVGNSPYAVALADINNDGFQDILITNYGSASISVLTGAGTGVFGGLVQYGMGNQPWAIALGDFDNDGFPDVVTANRSTNNISVRLNDGIGGFGSQFNTLVGSQPSGVVVGYFNGDNNLDLAVSNRGSNNVSILLGAGNGTFTLNSTPSSGSGPNGIVIGDIDNDGILDLITANNLGDNISFLKGNMPNFNLIGNSPTSISPFKPCIGDFNGDGNLDVVVPTITANNLSLLYGNGGGGFPAPISINSGSGTPQPRVAAVGDFNKDGKQDIAVANYSNSSVGIILSCPTTLTTSSVPTSICRGSNISVPFTGSGTYFSGNIFQAQLSDATGSFASPTVIGTISSTSFGSIPAIIPAGQALGNAYRIRVVSTFPIVTSSGNGSNITLIPLPTITGISPNPAAFGMMVTLSGSNFTGATNVRFGGITASSFVVVNSSTITAVVGAGNTGNVTVSASCGTATNTSFIYASPIIWGFSPSSGSIGSLVTINGSNLGYLTDFKIGGVSPLVITGNSTVIVAFVMPGATTGLVSITTPGGNVDSGSNFTVTPTGYPCTQQGAKLVGPGNNGSSWQGSAVAISADGNRAIVGGENDNVNFGAVWTFARAGGVWASQSGIFWGSGASGPASQGVSVAMSADGNTLLIGGNTDATNQGAVWVFYSGTQQGLKLVGTGNVGAASQGGSVSISADGNTAIIGGNSDNANQGAAWIWTRSGGIWTQQGAKLVGTGNVGAAQQGQSVSISADGNTAIVGGNSDNANQGAAWIWTRSGSTWTQQAKLVGTGNVGAAQQGRSVSISADGNTAVIGGNIDNTNQGAVWIFTRSGSTWTQQGAKLVGSGNVGGANQGRTVSLSADGNTLMVGGFLDNTGQGASWVFTRNGSTWTQRGTKLVGSGNTGAAQQGYSVALSADGNTAIEGGNFDSGQIGATWSFISSPAPTIGSFTPTTGGFGSVITLSGSNFSGINSVSFGGITASSFVVVNSTTITAVVGAGASGSVSVVSNCGTATLGGFTYLPPSITSFTPSSGSVGSLVTITGTALLSATGVSIGGVQGLIISKSATQIVGFVMPGATTGLVSITTPGGNVDSGSNFSITPTPYPCTQQGNKLIGAGGIGTSGQGYSVSISADGNTAAVGGLNDNGNQGAVWIYTRNAGVWNQQARIVAIDNIGTARQGASVALSEDGNTLIFGGYSDNSSLGAAWVYTRNAGLWSLQSKLIGTGAIGTTPNQGWSVALSADGNTALVGGSLDNASVGATWVFVRNAGVWSQMAKLVGSGNIGASRQGTAVGLSGDGNTAIIGGIGDNGNIGAAWIFNRTGGVWSQMAKLIGAGNTGASRQGFSVAISADAKTVLIGGYTNNSNNGATWVFTGSGGSWTQQAILNGTGAIVARQGTSVSLSADGNTAVVGGSFDNGNVGAIWTFQRNGSTWNQSGSKLVGTSGVGTSSQGFAVDLSADGNVAIVGGSTDNSNIGATWVFISSPAPTIGSFTPTSGSIGSVITLSGSNFSGINSVSFGGITASSFVVVNSTTITAVVGAGASGSVSVVSNCGTSTLGGFLLTPLLPGSISGSSMICAGNIPAPLSNISSASGGCGSFTYQWSRSIDSLNWTNLSGSNTVNYTPLVAVTQKTWFRRRVVDGCLQTATTNPVVINMIPPVGNPTVFGINMWNAYAYIDASWATYSGTWTEGGISFNSIATYGNGSPPSNAPFYQGCAVNPAPYSVKYRRQGFPTGTYNIVLSADDYIDLRINGSLIYQTTACGLCGSTIVAWSGLLSSIDQIEINHNNPGGPGYARALFNLVTITTSGILPTSYCGGSLINVPFTGTGLFSPGNVFTAQLSDASGSFVSPSIIGTLTSTTFGTITSFIPSNQPIGTNYKIRVISSLPSVTSAGSIFTVTINGVSTITSFSPSSGMNGSIITLSGTNFSGINSVSFGGITATSFTLVNSNTITAVVGAGASGAVSVVSNCGTATLGGFTFLAIPTISSFSPRSAVVGSVITINGANFDPVILNNKVKIGGIVANVIFASTTKLEVVVPFGASFGLVSVEIGGRSSFSKYAFSVSNSALCDSLGTPGFYLTGNGPRGVAVGDFNNDGNPDIATVNNNVNTISILLGNGLGGLGTKQDYNTGSGANAIAVGDLNGDGYQDVITANRSDFQFSYFEGNGDGTFDPRVNYPTGSFPFGLGIADFNNDGRPDVVTANNDDIVSVMLALAGGGFAAPQNYTIRSNMASLALGDFNKDGNWDIATIHSVANVLSVIFGDGNGSFGTNVDYGTNPNIGPQSVVAGDFNNDGNQDLAVACLGTNNLAIFGGSPSGVFTNIFTISNPASTIRSLAVGDFNGDNILDLVSANGTANSITRFWGLGNGSFGTPVINTAGSNAWAVAVADFDKSGTQDIINVNYGSSEAFIYSTVCTPISSTPVFHDGLWFDGVNDFAELQGVPVSDDFSISFWMKTNQTFTASGASWYKGVGLVDATDGDNDFGVSMSNGRILFGSRAGGEFTNESVQTVNDNKWHHITVTRNRSSGEVIIYVDGIANGPFIQAAGLLTGPTTMTLGRIRNDPSLAFHGQLDDLRLYDVVLPPSTISNSAFRNFMPGLTTLNLKTYFSMDRNMASGDTEISIKDLIGGTNGDLDYAGGTAPLFTRSVFNTSDNISTVGSLRWAIENPVDGVNNIMGKNYIDFSIQETNPTAISTFSPSNEYILTDPLVIDGYSAYGSSQNTLQVGNNAQLRVAVDFSGLGGKSVGIQLNGAQNSLIRGFSFVRMPNDGGGAHALGSIGSSSNNTISGCWFGIYPNGNGSSTYMNMNGINFSLDGGYNLIGGPLPEHRNIISNSEFNGVVPNSNNNIISNNYIGTNPTGLSAMPNGERGISIYGIGNLIKENLISGNANGIFGNLSSSQCTIVGNFIGTNASGSSALPNNQGIFLGDGSNSGIIQNYTIGDSTNNNRNIIAFNTSNGISINGLNSTINNIRISGNSIFENGFGIALANGGNNNKPAPSITSAFNNAVSGTTSQSGDIIQIFYDSPQSGATDQGRIYLGQTTAVGLNWTFTATLTTGSRITATATDGVNGTSPFSAAATVSSFNPFITTWQTTTANETITIPTNGAGYNYSVNWGDGSSISTGLTGNATHTYTTPGIYSVAISGSFPRIFFNNTGDRLKLRTIQQWGDIAWGSMANAFRGCSNMTYNATDSPVLTAAGISMAFMFSGCTTFTGNGTMNNWNTANVTDMGDMFGSTAFNQPINSWNTSLVTSMRGMFFGSPFNQPISTSGTSWNVSNVVNMQSMFQDNTVFNQNIANWNLGNLVNMRQMFANNVAFNQNLSSWDVGKVTNFASVFQSASNFNNGETTNTSANPLNWNVGAAVGANPINMTNMFFGASKFNQDISTWNTGNVTNMFGMFNTASVFNQSISGWNTGNITNMLGTFRNAIAFNQSLASWNLSNVTVAGQMLDGAGLSVANYDASLISWSLQSLKPNISLGANGLTYCNAISARSNIISLNNWTITGDNLSSACIPNMPLGNRGVYLEGNVTSGSNLTTSSLPSNSTDNLTLEAWVKVERFPSTECLVVFNGNSGSNGYGLHILPSGQVTGLLGAQGRVYSNIFLTINQWTHLTIVREVGLWKFYLNGALAGYGTGPFASPNTSAPFIPTTNLTIGNGAGGTNGFAGQIDEVRIFNVARTTAQIQQDMGSNSANGAVGYWNFEESNGNVALDQSGSGNNATFVNNPLRSLRVTDNTDNNTIGLGSLRQAINDANTDTDKDYIDFSLPSGTQTIQPTATYTLNNPVLIDGFSQLNTIPGENSRANTNPFGQPINAKLNVVINGALAGFSDAFLLTSNNAEIKGLVVNGFSSSSGFNFSNAYSNVDFNKISGCFIGTNRNGSAAVPNLYGFVASGASPIRTGNIIGGVNQENRNLISGNTFAMIDFNPWSNGLIQNNYIGTNAVGNAAIPNTNGAISGLIWSINTTITSNVISGNGGDGINIGSNFPSNYIITGNRIGTLADGTGSLPNAGNGISIYENYSNRIGGTLPSEQNIIANNTGYGIWIEFGTAINNKVLGNAVYNNILGGINLVSGGNNNKPAPAITSAYTNAISGTTSQSGDIIQIFYDSPQSGVTDQGRIYLGQTTAVGLNWTFTATLTTGSRITATATDGVNGTSPFSTAAIVTNYIPPTQPLGNRGLYFDGVQQYATLSQVPQSAATIEMWVKMRSPNYGVLFSNNQYGTVGTFIETSSGGTRVSIGYDGGRTWIDFGDIFGLNVWHHFATTYDGNTLIVYLDGVVIGSQNISYGVYNSTNPLILANYGSSLNCEIDEVKIFGHIRTQAQIQADMGSTTPDGAYSYFNLDESTGQSLGNLGTSNTTGYLGSTNSVDANDALWALRTTNTLDDGSAGSLRWAITEANSDTDQDYIDFSLPSGIQTIQPTTTYSLNNPVLFDGFSQLNTIPGENSRANTNPFGQPINAKLNVVINGASAGSNDAFLLADSISVIKGLVVNGYASSTGFNFSTGSNVNNNKISGCFIGTNRDGTAAVPNNYGFQATGPSNVRTGNTIGGINQEDRNLISGNSIGIADFNTWYNGLIQNNYIGTNAAGNAAIPNFGGGGIEQLLNSQNVIIANNVISGNAGGGVFIASASSGYHVVKGNRIGTTADGLSSLPNGANGITIFSNSNNTVGGLSIGDANIIANNGANGVSIMFSGINNIVLNNSIYNNISSGIDLTSNGNNGKSAPLITNAYTDRVFGTCQSGDLVEVFYDSPQFGATNQGRVYLGQATTTGTNWSFSATLTIGSRITATATDGVNGTSSFSVAALVTIPVPAAALNFSGTNNIVSSNLWSTSLKNFTMEANVYWNGSNGSNQAIMYNGLSSSNGYGLVIQSGSVPANQLTILMGGVSWNTTGTILATNTWNKIAAVNDNGNWSLYLNGSLLTLSTYTAVPNSITGISNSFIGNNEATTSGFNGTIDNVRFWNRPLCQAEISAHLSCEKPASSTGLIARYDFNTGFGGQNNAGEVTAIDSSGNGNNGTLYNFSLTSTVSNWVANGAVLSGSTCAGVTIPAGGTWTWVGGNSTDWFSPCNWDKLSVPNATANVIIPGLTPNQPTISNGTAFCNTITINTDNGGILNLDSSGGGVLNVTQ